MAYGQNTPSCGPLSVNYRMTGHTYKIVLNNYVGQSAGLDVMSYWLFGQKHNIIECYSIMSCPFQENSIAPVFVLIGPPLFDNKFIMILLVQMNKFHIHIYVQDKKKKKKGRLCWRTLLKMPGHFWLEYMRWNIIRPY